MITSGEIKRAKQKAVGGKRDRCRKGKSCSATCISRWKACLVEMSDAVSSSLTKAKSLLGGKIYEAKKRNRYNSFDKARKKLVMALEDAAKVGDQKKYAKLEKAILKAEDRANKSLGLSKTFKKRGLWIEDLTWVAREETLDGMFKAMVAGDRAKYDKLERRLGTFEDKLKLVNKSSPTPGEFWTKNKGLAQFMGNLEENGIKNGRGGVRGVKLKEQIVSGGHMLGIESSVLGNKLKIVVSPDSLSFKVNDSYVSKGDLPRRDTVAITREVMRQFDVVISSLKEGTVLQVSAARGDGKGGMREDAYAKFGFSRPNRWGDMFGRVENGKIVPIGETEYNAGHRARFRE